MNTHSRSDAHSRSLWAASATAVSQVGELIILLIAFLQISTADNEGPLIWGEFVGMWGMG